MSQHVIDLSALAPSQGFVIQGDAVGDWAGWSVSAAGDVNGDGFGDMLIGAPNNNDGGYLAGSTYVLFGGADEFGEDEEGRQVIDLSTLSEAQGFVIQGARGASTIYASGDNAGFSVSTAGDINGDGFDDVIVGARFGDDGGEYAGEAYVLFGDDDGFGTTIDGRQVIDLATLSSQQGFVFQGDEAGDLAGYSVSTAGDVNGDGFDDVIVGAPGGTGAGGGLPGKVYVLFGGAGGFGDAFDGRQVIDSTTLTAEQGFVIIGEGPHDLAGYSVSAAGDINGDGHDDVIVGAIRNVDNAGAAYVLFGGVSGFGETIDSRQVVDLSALSGTEGFVIQGSPDEFLGSGVSGAGDINDDGFADVIIGGEKGRAYVLFGGDNGFGMPVDGRQVVDLTTLGADQGFVIEGSQDALAGVSVSDAGDVNGDGVDDVIIGAPGEPGQAYVVFGNTDGFGTPQGGRQVVDLSSLTADQGFVIRGAMQFDLTGHSVSAGQDVDGDGFDDLIVGAPFGGGGNAYVVFGGNFTDAVANVGTDGDDRIDSNATGETIFGAQGDDTLFGNGGCDSLNGGAGTDSLNGGAGADSMAGGSGNDSAIGGSGNDSALGGDGNDMLSGRAGNDSLAGEANDDTLTGNAGDDSLDGGQGRDVLSGDDGNDTLVGGGRGDVLIGGEGADVLIGGTGGDRFGFAAGSSSPATPDTVTDFRGGFDKLVIRTGSDHGSFLGQGAFTGAGGIEVRYDAGLHQLQVDLNGDGRLETDDLVISGTSLATLTADDLLFV